MWIMVEEIRDFAKQEESLQTMQQAQSRKVSGRRLVFIVEVKIIKFQIYILPWLKLESMNTGL